MVRVQKENEEYAKYHDDPRGQFPYCQSCHVTPGRKFTLALDDSGKIATPLQEVLSYQEIRKRALHNKVPFAKVLRMTLKAQAGGLGLYHFGGEIFEGSSDPDYKKLMEWVNIENSDMSGEAPPTSRAEACFAEKVLPVDRKVGFFKIRRLRNAGVFAFLDNQETLFPEQKPEGIFWGCEERFGSGYKRHRFLSF